MKLKLNLFYVILVLMLVAAGEGIYLLYGHSSLATATTTAIIQGVVTSTPKTTAAAAIITPPTPPPAAPVPHPAAAAIISPSAATSKSPTDTQPPTAPSGLAAIAASNTQLNLSWNPSSDNVGVIGYKIYRNGTMVGSAQGLKYAAINLLPSTAYSFTVAAYDAAGNVSPPSTALSATTPTDFAATPPPAPPAPSPPPASPSPPPSPPPAPTDTTPPTTPTGLTAAVASQTQINLSWIASTDNTGVTGYYIYRNGSQIASAAGTSYQDTGLVTGTTYSYTVAAYDAAGNASSRSTATSATTQSGGGSPPPSPPPPSPPPPPPSPPPTDTMPPTRPTGMTAIAVSATQVKLTWIASTDNTGVTGYKIFRNGSQAVNTAGTSYQDTGLVTGTTYSYTVAAYDAAGNTSQQSVMASVTTK